jgi:muramidase (phage lysozyme)
MAKQIEAYKLRTELAVDSRAGQTAIQNFQKQVDSLAQSFKKLGTQIDTSTKAKEAGSKWGKGFGDAATAAISGSFDDLGSTIGALIGTAMAPGVGTVIGQTIGSGVDTAINKISGALKPVIKEGIALNEEIEKTTIEFTTFTGSVQEAHKYLGELKKLSADTGNDFRWVINTSERIQDLTGNLQLTTKIMKAATDQAADFGGEAETILKIGEALGVVAEKGELAQRDLKGLYRLGIDAKKYLAEATGWSEKYIAQLIKAGRIRGDVAVKYISEGIEQQKGGFAEKLARTTAEGRRRRFGVALTQRAAEGTERYTKVQGEAYEVATRALESDPAKQFVKFIDDTTGALVDLAKKGAEYGVQTVAGLADGMTGTEAMKQISNATTTVASSIATGFTTVLGIKSPSQLMIDKVGIPLGEGIADGMAQGFAKSYGKSRDQIVAMLEALLKDPQVQALLATIKQAEGGAPGRIVGYGGTVTDLSKHPNRVGLVTSKGPSTAAGNYQITYTNWRRLSKQLGLPDFGEHSQALAALKLMIDHAGGIEALQSGDVSRMMGLAAQDWTSTTGSTIGGGGQWSRGKWVGAYQRNLAAATGGSAGAVPVNVVAWDSSKWKRPASDLPDIEGGARAIFGTTAPARRRARAGRPGYGGSAVADMGQDADALAESLGKANTVIVKTTDHTKDLIEVDTEREAQMARATSITERATQQVAVTNEVAAKITMGVAKDAAVFAKKYHETARAELRIGINYIDQISAAIPQMAGFLPQQQVGKKRSLFSKILGIAAPFLSFLPGVGPILSSIAGAAGQAVGGNWSSVASSIASGLAPGGVFRSTGGGSSASGDTINPNYSDIEQTTRMLSLTPRAFGGPVYQGHRYIVGEYGAETFSPAVNGHISPHGSGGEMAAAAAELRAAIAHLNSMPAQHVVMQGARGLVRAMDQDAGLIRLVGQRQRLA